MKKMLAGVLGSLAVVIAGCGDSGNSTACLMGSGTSQICIETTTNAGPVDCGASTRVDACPHAGADGACRFSISQGGVSLTQTVWYYSGTSTSSEMSNCMQNAGVWIQP
jgi:hypothetical protein